MGSLDENCYAVENAVAELKEKATAVIRGNEEDGMAKWLEENYREAGDLG